MSEKESKEEPVQEAAAHPDIQLTHFILYTTDDYPYNIGIGLKKGGERMIDDMPTDIQFKDDLRKEEIRIENQLELLENKEYDKLKKQLLRDLKRVRESLQD